ncbi:acyl-CoA thioesterase [Halioglobus pacificus]|uniref:Acyl-CoA thioesterase II n=1 Tax=Parahalioglobus pacificus TaxID=930806 RepID=A0A919CID5_9GAMM|nr:acyl-CoA thioesterase domain-containing protein [Halioglobus pacificus]NQY01992.1 thioesterase family protein [Halieaceae bacterium]GHD27695.1 acyl-CoA thioesterase II [Halioglobus pacificus]
MLDQLLDVLQVKPEGELRFLGDNMHPKAYRVYGGQVLAQAVMAARYTVDDDRELHSQHAYFLRPGNPREDIHFTVEPALDGGSFSSRRVVASQQGKPILVSSISFQRPGEGEVFQASKPAMPAPDSLPSERELALKDGKLDDNFMITTGTDLDVRVEDPIDWDNPVERPPVIRAWMKTTEALPDQPALHQSVLAYMSDCFLIDVCLATRGLTFQDGSLQVASLDHALWFHRPLRADQWLLHEVHAEAMAGGRGLGRGNFYTEDGTLVATTMQQGLMRPR